MTELKNKQCVPCKGGEEPLDEETIQILLNQVADEWKLNDEGHLVRTVTGKDFMDVVEKIRAIAEIAEQEGHHPNLHLHDYKKLTIELYTHKIKGLHENDFILASKIDEYLA